MALLIDVAYELFGFLRRPWVDVAQQTIQREHACPDEVGRVLDGLWWHAVHLDHILARLPDGEAVLMNADPRGLIVSNQPFERR